jgi:uncharacterized membrane protein YcjF (UPF0283 family)
METKARTGKRVPVRRIVLLAFVVLVLLEPVVMYRVLQRQKEARQAERAAQDNSLSVTPDTMARSVGQ